jgi:uncharacterized membrane protein YhfC
MHITPSDIAFNLIGVGMMLAIVYIFIFYWKKLTGGLLRWVGMGCLVWFIAVVIKAALGIFLNEPVLNFLKILFGNAGYFVLGSIWIGLLTGLTEIIFGYVVARNRKYITLNEGTGYGLGFGAIKAALFAIVIATLVLIEMFIPGILPAEALKLIQDTTFDTATSSNLERISALFIHIASGVLIVYSLATKKLAYFWLAFVYKSTVDEIAASLHLTGIVTKMNP